MAHEQPGADRSLTIALVGNPNTGKSSLFSSLCGVRTRVGNYPGVTVEKKIGRYTDEDGLVTVVDLPGTYSLTARTLDEKVSVDVLLDKQPDVSELDVVVAIVDACNLERNLYLFSQLRELGKPIVLVLNMWDRVQAEGIQIELETLQERLQVEIVTSVATRGSGIAELKAAVRRAATVQPRPPRVLGETFQAEMEQLRDWIDRQAETRIEPFLVQRLLLDVESPLVRELKTQHFGLANLENQLIEARERLEAQGMRVPAVETRLRYQWIRRQLQDVVQRPDAQAESISDRIDHILTHRVWGVLAFALVMFFVFQGITWGTSWFMDRIVEDIQPWLTSLVTGLMPPGTLRSLINNGIIAGVGSVIVFLPQIVMLFFFIGLLEDCGYMARAAFVMDKLMTKLGLSGKSFLPLMSSFACAVPGIMATRTIENTRDRMVTILVAPLMSCSARLPVYVLLIYTFVPDYSWLGGWIGLRGIVLFAMHLIGAVVAIPVALVLKRTFFPGETPAFVMELPSYKVPSLRVVLHRVGERARAFITRAGGLIFLTAIIVWAAGYFPADHAKLHALSREIEAGVSPAQEAILEEQQRRLNKELIERSFLGRFGKLIEPVVRPLGWDWRIGVGAIASFPAREVIIATLGTIYALGGDVDEGDEGLQDALRKARWPDGEPVVTLAVAFSIMVFFALCAQCGATLMVIRRETNSWWWPVFTFVYMTALAYVGALITYQVGSQIFSA